MAGPITSIYEAVTAALAGILEATAVTVTSDDGTKRTTLTQDDGTVIVCALGRKNLLFNDDARRVVWYPTKEPAENPSSSGSENDTLQARRTLWRRRTVLVAQIWGRDFDEAEALAEAVAGAMDAAALGQWEYAPLGGEWEVDAASGSDNFFGEAVYHAYECLITVTAPAVPTTTQGAPVTTGAIVTAENL